MLKLVPKIFRNLNAFSLIVILLISFITCILIASVFPVSKGQVQSDFTSYSKLTRTTSPRNHASVQKSRLFAQKRSHDSATSSIKVQRPSGGHKVPAYRVVHLDLKGAPPKLSYLRQLFPLIASAGANALLLEYEDMFPYQGSVANASALNSWSIDQVKELGRMAKQYGFQVIPLLQTFGHMEHVLKLSEFVHLREMSQYPQSICPSHKASFSIIKQMIDQVLAAHPEAKYLHIGCDEVFQLGVCSKCRETMRRFGLSTKRNIEKKADPTIRKGRQLEHGSPRTLYLNHVKRVADYVRETTSNRVTPLIWDDMLRSIPYEELRAADLASSGIQPVVWVYVEDIDHFVDEGTWSKYSRLFPGGVWTASAFKGAFGERLFMPNMLRHYENHLAWTSVMNREARRINFKGIVFTGWSRYDHFAVLCELLPTAVPSLVLNILAVVSGSLEESQTFQVASKVLNCPGRLNPEALKTDPHQFELRRCNFPGSEIYGAVGSLTHFKVEVESLDTSSRESQGWLTGYNIRHNYSSPWRLSEAIGGHEYLVKALNEYAEKTSISLGKIYEKSTVDEWIEQNVYPLQDKTVNLLKLIDQLTARRTWPRRPIP